MKTKSIPTNNGWSKNKTVHGKNRCWQCHQRGHLKRDCPTAFRPSRIPPRRAKSATFTRDNTVSNSKFRDCPANSPLSKRPTRGKLASSTWPNIALSVPKGLVDKPIRQSVAVTSPPISPKPAKTTSVEKKKKKKKKFKSKYELINNPIEPDMTLDFDSEIFGLLNDSNTNDCVKDPVKESACSSGNSTGQATDLFEVWTVFLMFGELNYVILFTPIYRKRRHIKLDKTFTTHQLGIHVKRSKYWSIFDICLLLVDRQSTKLEFEFKCDSGAPSPTAEYSEKIHQTKVGDNLCYGSNASVHVHSTEKDWCDANQATRESSQLVSATQTKPVASSSGKCTQSSRYICQEH